MGEGNDSHSSLFPPSVLRRPIIVPPRCGRCRSKPCGCRRKPSSYCTVGHWQIGQVGAAAARGAFGAFRPAACPAMGPGRWAAPEPCRPMARRRDFLADWIARVSRWPAAKMIEAAIEHLIGRLAAMLVPLRPGGTAAAMPLSFSGACAAWRLPSACSRPRPRPGTCSACSSCNWSGCGCPARCGRCRWRPRSRHRLECRQQELFPDDRPALQPRRLAGLVERLSSRLGRQAVVRARLRPEAQPELACRLRSAGAEKAGRRSRGPAAAAARIAAAAVAVVAAAAAAGGHVGRARRPAGAIATGAAGSSRSRIAGGRSGSRPAGGAAGRSAAIITASRPPPAAAFGSFAACATDRWFLHGSSIDGELETLYTTNNAVRKRCVRLCSFYVRRTARQNELLFPRRGLASRRAGLSGGRTGLCGLGRDRSQQPGWRGPRPSGRQRGGHETARRRRNHAR